jgi:hypothetical protein
MVKYRMMIIILIINLILVLGIPTTFGGNQTVYIPMTNDSSTDIVVSPTTWDHYELHLTNVTATNTTDFTLDNNGTVQVDVTVVGTNSAGWTLDTSAGHNQFALDYKLNDTGDWTDITTTPVTFASDLAHDQYKEFGLQIALPTTTSQTSTQNLQITFTATAD